MTRGSALGPAALVVVLGTALVACSGPRPQPTPDQPTLASLGSATTGIERDAPGTAPTPGAPQTIKAYRDFLAAAPPSPQRGEALRRLGDLEMDQMDERVDADTAADTRAAIAAYERFLREHPGAPRTDRALYQLARAQELSGQLEAALATLTRLVQDHPGSVHADEAHFRRGELLFAQRHYGPAEAAYTAVLGSSQPTALHERALYMQGWARFKQDRLEAAIEPLLGVLDAKLGTLLPRLRDEPDLAAINTLSRGDRELVEDTLRVLSIALSKLQGAETVPGHIDSPVRQGYGFRLYQHLAELYLKQERIKDAADTLAAFVRRHPLHALAPMLQARVVEIYAGHGFDTLALQAKTEHAVRYGAGSALRQANPGAWSQTQPQVKTYLTELARHHHARAQQTHAPDDAQQAVRWYRALLGGFPKDADAPGQRFLLAELLFESRQFEQAALEYETVAYAPGAQAARAADAGYGALLAYAAQEREAGDVTALQHTAVASALRYAAAFPGDSRSAAVLARAAQMLYTLGEGERAAAVARQALATPVAPELEQRRVAWAVIAHQAFDSAAFNQAEQAYAEVLAITPQDQASAFIERQAAAIYKQGEQARAGGELRQAVQLFMRIGALSALPAHSEVRAAAQFDAAAVLVVLKDWPAATQALQDFRRQFAGHALQAEIAPLLAQAYLEQARPAEAADEFDRIADAQGETEPSRAARWRAAELRHQAALASPPRSPQRSAALKTWERWLQHHPQPLERALQARWQIAVLAREDGQSTRAAAAARAVQQADQQAGEQRTALTRSLGGQAALLLAEPLLATYQAVPLVEPLQRQLKLKKARLEDVLRAYAAAAEVGVAEITTEASFRVGALYQDFGQALLRSQRPRRLNKAELEQYSVMLEEQAFPFEEKAIELFETNARRTRDGVYDRWVKASLEQLARLKPARYAKTERGAAPGAGDIATLEAALRDNPRQPQLLNQLGIAQRLQGRFDQARTAYEAAIALDAQAIEPQFNLAILLDLYLGEPAPAQVLVQRCLELSPADAGLLGKWLAELKSRKPAPAAADPAAPPAKAATVATGKDKP